MKRQNHSGSGDNIHGNKEVHVYFKITKYLLYSIPVLLLISLFAFYLSKDKIIESHVVELFQEIGINLEKYYTPNSNTSTYTRLRELNSEIQDLIDAGLELNKEQELLYASSLSTLGNYKEAYPHFKQSYLLNKNSTDISNLVTTLTSFCYCSAYANNNIDEVEEDYEEISKRIENENNYEYKRLVGNIYMCKAINCSQKDDIQCVIKNLENFVEYYNYSAHAYINSIDFNLSKTSKSSKEYLKVINEMKMIYDQQANLMNSK